MSAGAIHLWKVTEPAHPTSLGTITGGFTSFVNSVAFSPDGRTLAGSSGQPTFTAGTIHLWDLTDPARPARLRKTFNNDGVPVLSVAFSPDGRTLASGTGDGQINLWKFAQH